MRVELGETRMVAHGPFEKNGCLVLEVSQHDRVRTPVLQGFDAVSQLHRAVAEHSAGSSVLLSQLTIHRPHVLAFPVRARLDGQRTDILMPQGFSGRRQLRGSHA